MISLPLAIGLAFGAFVLGFFVGRAGGRGTVLEVRAPVVVAAPPDDPDFLAHVQQRLRAGQMIEAIKVYRERTGVGLKEAKDAVEDIQRRM